MSGSMNVKQFIDEVGKKKIDPLIHIKTALQEVKKANKEFHFMNIIADEQAIKQAEVIKKNPKGKLAGLPVSIKDCIVVKGLESKAGSAILEGYKPVYDATVVQRLKDEGAIIIGKTAQDAFGFGTFSVNVGNNMEIPLNPIDKERSCGGSSGGSGAITKWASFPHISIGESTGGSIAAPAAFCGVFGLCPTYGRVSRYGLMDYASSLDKIGPMASSSYDLALSLSVIAGHDPNDATSLKEPADDYLAAIKKEVNGLKVGIIKESFGEGIDPQVSKEVKKAIEVLKKKGLGAKEISLPLVAKYGVSCYYLIAMSEASTNLAKYCGMRYGRHEKLEGNFNEYFTKVRSKHFNQETKRRIIIGTFARMAGYRDAYYIKAAKVRTKIISEYKAAFKEVDVLISPTMPIISPKFDDIKKLTPLQNYMMDIMTVGPNLAGLPHCSIPIGNVEGMPVGMMAIGDHLEEKKVLQVASVFG
ncbi:aspartyl/glutamyl-tRNA amidotransferase subunit A [Candidatus Woesearchaeota archaeon]|nr:hypothetical protein [uncultured archaeon]MBS3129928.1 aspartyl/glutamyl-tRNA amidotransferase subunit A [Candidatus Woesearchaeota archaeon]HIH38067.1 Asp-tRNA(Asn)/Glu-tRNA(Gln) amidotransferase subunit GatA [Candidatus Woesearchaeota archaeon]HIH48163.1 Asp-tRNA(Asn)/Glu-tRNA(Gln) amidotransferase subunit GatA [Candidatus Woesearchaeota archaeon]HIJ04308.1 Asp-tRNA(Asn)/Glu-tRNA(Gln) amidotransferase subunit GatA [Candidatus Woesearchaeota archaeon]